LPAIRMKRNGFSGHSQGGGSDVMGLGIGNICQALGRGTTFLKTLKKPVDERHGGQEGGPRPDAFNPRPPKCLVEGNRHVGAGRSFTMCRRGEAKRVGRSGERTRGSWGVAGVSAAERPSCVDLGPSRADGGAGGRASRAVRHGGRGALSPFAFPRAGEPAQLWREKKKNGPRGSALRCLEGPPPKGGGSHSEARPAPSCV